MFIFLQYYVGPYERIYIMKTKVYELFRKCFPQFSMPEDTFIKLLDADSCKLIPYYEHEAFAGCAAVSGNCIRLVCVDPDYRGRGIGSKLMEKSEQVISENGFDKAVLGGRDSELFIGAVTPENQWKDMRNRFFEREGYSAGNGCLEMKMSLGDFDFDTLDIPACPSDVSFGYLPESKKDELYKAVEQVSPEWLEYFGNGSPVFAAEKDGKIVGFCIVDVDADTIISTESNNVGMIGCVGVIPEMRRCGIGLAMVANAMQDIKGKGCDDVFIHYTYLDWWYGRLGFKTFLHYWFGEKELNRQ